MNRWPHQTYALEETLRQIAQGTRRICVTTPTGGGKTLEMADLIEHFLSQGKTCSLYTNRRLLIEQTSKALTGHGLEHGIRAADYEQGEGFPLQISSVQSEHERVFVKKVWKLHPSDLVVIDEAHQQTGPVMRRILDRHREEHNAVIVGYTATPLDLAGMYDVLIVAGKTSELRACGALVRAIHYAPDEPDMRAWKKLKLREGEDISGANQRQMIMTPTIWGRVFANFKRINPDCRATILFAPDVAGSIWFAEQFSAKGVSAAHIDGQEVWINGRVERTSRNAREDVLGQSRDGKVKVLCNRYVCREGVNAPWLCHGIFACVFGSLGTYLQSGGRLLRSSAGIDAVTVQDHGGNWWRHGSLNADREWRLGITGAMAAGLRADALREQREPPPICCPRCRAVVMFGRICVCGWNPGVGKHSRPVVSAEGELTELAGDIFRRRRLTKLKDADARWEKMYWRARSNKWNATFKQAEARFAEENQWGWPPRNLPMMPLDPWDWFQRVADVPFHRLIPKGA